MTEENLRRTEMRSIVLQLERLMSFPMVRERVERGEVCLHGWYYVIEEGQVLGLDMSSGEFRPLS
jgi:carbonic anhydrase